MSTTHRQPTAYRCLAEALEQRYREHPASISPHWQQCLREQDPALRAVPLTLDTGSRDWSQDPPSPHSGALPRVALSVADLPEVQTLVAEGFELAPEASFLVFLPAIWPQAHRTWVVDRGTRYSTVTCTTGSTSVVTAEPWDDDDRNDIDADLEDLCGRAGVRGWRPGRLWLLRGPAALGVEVVVDAAMRAAEVDRIRNDCSPEFVAAAAAVVSAAFAWSPRGSR